MEYIEYMQQNKSLKPTVTRVTPFAANAKPAPRYGGSVPPFHGQCFESLPKFGTFVRKENYG